MFDFPDNFKLIFRFVHGSHLYGTSTPLSDLDIRGVFIPSKEYFFGFSKKVEQFECKEPDITYFEMRKFLSLALDCNPNIIEFLFVPFDYEPVKGESVTVTPEWKLISEHRQYFLSTKARWTFSGYAVSQLHRLKKHRNWLIYGENIVEPKREDYGLPVNRKLISSDQIGAFNVVVANRLEEIAQLHEFKDQLLEMQVTVDYIGLVQSMIAKKSTTEVVSLLPEINANFIYAIQKEKEYAQDKKEYDQYLNWKATRNLARYELEAKYKYDTKHAAHCYRLITEGEELLKTGTITFPRPDRELLTAIRNGCWTFDEMMEKIGDVDKVFDELYKQSPLPKKPDRQVIDDLCCEITDRYIKGA